MKNFTTGLYTHFTELIESAHNDFYTSVGGRMYYGERQSGSAFPCATFEIKSSTQDDSFTEDLAVIDIFFSLFSSDNDADEIMDMETYLKALYKDCVFTVSDGTVASMSKVDSIGPYPVQGDNENAAEKYWQTDIVYEVVLVRSR